MATVSRRLALAWLLATTVAPGSARADPDDGGLRVYGNIARFYTGATTGWQGTVLVDPSGDIHRRPLRAEAPGNEDGERLDTSVCERLATAYGVTQGVEVNYSEAHYTEGVVQVGLTDACEGIGFPLAALSLGVGTRYRADRAYAGQQYTLSFSGLPWPFLDFYVRRIINDAHASWPGTVPAVQAGIMFKIPVPIWGFDWGAGSEEKATSPEL